MSATVLDSILGGTYDDLLDGIEQAVGQRRSVLVRRVRVGATIRFSEKIRPKYLVGKEATVVKVNRQSVTVACPNDPAYGRFCNVRSVRCPMELIDAN